MNETVEKWLLASPMPTKETLQLWVVVAALALAWGLSIGWARKVRALALVPPVALGLIAIGRALQTAWLADDAFITFRYSANWANGLGPVWNAGERVEGYTNPLWMAVLALGERLGAPAPWFSTALNLTALVALVAGTWWALRKAFDATPVLPIVLCLSPAVREFGTSGLETLPASAAVTGAALALLLGARVGVAGALVCVAAMLRPDHALFFAPLGFAAVSSGTMRERVRNAVDLVIPALVFVAFWVLRWQWYGDFYPNTYYAKSAALPYWEQGGVYLAEFVTSTRLWWPALFAPLGALALWAVTRTRATRAETSEVARVPFFVFTLLGGALWLTYVARVGGDFMEFRFALSALPLLGLATEAMVWSQGRAPFAARLGVAFVAMLPLAQSRGMVDPRGKTLHIALESSFYPVQQWKPLVVDNPVFRQAMALAASKPPSELLAAGCIGMVGYYNLPVPIFDTYGKTSREIARRPVEKRGRPGHEKTATRDDLKSAGVVWSVDPIWASLNDETKVRQAEVEVWLVRLSPSMDAWTRALGQPIDATRLLRKVTGAATALERMDELELLFEREPKALDAHLDALGLLAPRRFTCDAARTHCEATVDCGDELLSLGSEAACTVSIAGGASGKWARCTGSQRVSVTCSTTTRAQWVITRAPADYAARLAAARPRGAVAMAEAARHGEPGAPRLLTVDFEGALPPEVMREGTAMTTVPGTAPQQLEVRGFEGTSLLNTYASGDEARGSLTVTVPLDTNAEHLVSALFGGGKKCAQLYFEASVDGVPLPRACGQDDERLRPHAWLIPPGARSLTLRAVDDSSEGWGHLLLDQVEVWRLP